VLLKPCPYCGSPVKIIDLGGGHVCVGCEECGMGGPVARNHDAVLAAQAWSILTTYRMCCKCKTKLISAYTKRTRELKSRIAELEAQVRSLSDMPMTAKMGGNWE